MAATVTFDEGVLSSLVARITQQVIKELDIPSIASLAAIKAVKQTIRPAKPVYTAKETAELLGINLPALQYRRASGLIKGYREKGGKGYLYSRQEIERVLGAPLD